MSILLTDHHVDRCVTLLALIQCATNPVERARYQDKHASLLAHHLELKKIRDDDPRIKARLAEIRATFEIEIVAAFCAGCGLQTGSRLSSRTEPLYCHACSISRMFKEAAKR